MSDTSGQPPIEQLVPHKGDMCLLDEVCRVGKEDLLAAICPARDDLFADDQGIPTWVGLEWMAQAIAAWSGHTMFNAGQKPHIGFLLGTRRYDCKISHFAFAHRYQVRIELDYMADNGLGSFRGEIHDEHGQLVANASLSVFQPDSDDMLDTMFNDDRLKDSQ